MNRNQENPHWVITRRVFLKASAASLAAVATSCAALRGPARGTARFGIVTDVHYADIDTRGTRHYRDSLAKLTECVDLMNAQKVDFLVHLGDFKDLHPADDRQSAADNTIADLRLIEGIFQRGRAPRYHVLGNHDEDCVSKAQFLANVKNSRIPADRSYYSFDRHGLHFVVLDANYLADGTDYDCGNFDWRHPNVPPEELAWLEADLAGAPGPVVGFIHQRLDGAGDLHVDNAAEVRHVLEASGKVLAVFQGHHHAGGYSRLEHIHYYTLKGMIEGPGPDTSAYAVVEVLPNRTIVVTGYRTADSKELAGTGAPVEQPT